MKNSKYLTCAICFKRTLLRVSFSFSLSHCMFIYLSTSSVMFPSLIKSNNEGAATETKRTQSSSIVLPVGSISACGFSPLSQPAFVCLILLMCCYLFHILTTLSRPCLSSRCCCCCCCCSVRLISLQSQHPLFNLLLHMHYIMQKATL